MEVLLPHLLREYPTVTGSSGGRMMISTYEEVCTMFCGLFGAVDLLSFDGRKFEYGEVVARIRGRDASAVAACVVSNDAYHIL